MEIISKIEELLLGNPNITFIEFGACDGYHTNLIYNKLKETHPIVNYYAVEPVTSLINNITLSYPNLRGNVKFFNNAVGEVNGKTKLYVSGGYEITNGQVTSNYYGSSSIRKPKHAITAFKSMTFSEGEVEVLNYDTFCLQNGITEVDFVWADIQGAEVDLIKGGVEMFKKTRYLYTEYCDGELYEGEIPLREIVALMPDFEVVHDFGGDVLLKNKLF